MFSAIVTLLVIAACLALGIAAAYVPLRMIVSRIASNVKQFVQRQRERRSLARDTTDRRSASEAPRQ